MSVLKVLWVILKLKSCLYFSYETEREVEIFTFFRKISRVYGVRGAQFFSYFNSCFWLVVCRGIFKTTQQSEVPTQLSCTTEFVRLFLFISRGKAIVASRNVVISAKYVIKIYAFGSAHVKFGVWVTASLSAVVFPAEPIRFWILIETSTPISTWN